jgi:hypothetical protein
MPLDRRHVVRRREEVDDRVEERLDALVLERGAAEDRHELHGDRRRADALADLVVRELLAGEVLLDEDLVVLDDHVDQGAARLLDLLVELGRDVGDRELLAEGLVVEDVLLALDDVDVAREELARADGELDREGLACSGGRGSSRRSA